MKKKSLDKNSNIKIAISSKSQDNIAPSPNFSDKPMIFYQQLIENTIIYLHKNRENDIISNNELSNAIETLEVNYKKLTKLDELRIKQGTITENDNKVLLEIKQSLNHTLLTTGTTSIINIMQLQKNIPVIDTDIYDDAIFIECKLNKDAENNKFKLLEKYVKPIRGKILQWTNPEQKHVKFLEKNKIIDDEMILNHSETLNCFDLSRTSKDFYIKVNGIKTVIHNYAKKYSIVIECIIDNIMVDCIKSQYISDFLHRMRNKIIDNKIYTQTSYNNYIDSLTLKEILIYSDDELLNKYYYINTQVVAVKQKNISQVVRDFITDDLYKQRSLLISLLLYSEEHEYQYIAYLLYDLLSNDNNGEVDTTEQTMLLNSLPWKIKCFFRDAMSQTIDYTNNLSSIDKLQIPLEQQICLMKAPEYVKEKAMNKLKEIKSKGDDNGTKAKQYLEGLLKIPFGVYKTEPILGYVTEIKTFFNDIISQINNIQPNTFDISMNYTNIQIKNICGKIKKDDVYNIQDKLVSSLITSFSKLKRNELIIDICKINNIIKATNKKEHKLVHSGKNIHFMKEQIISFVEKNKTNSKIMAEIIQMKSLGSYNNTNMDTNIISKNISLIDNKWNKINNYMNNVKATLDNAVHGHNKAKRQIERIIAQWINGEDKGYCFGFEGPPGCGKTSFAKNGLAKCFVDDDNVSRPFAFIAIGGQDNGSALTGHNYTYVGSEWGKFVDILIKNKCMNPVIFIDELDKVSRTENGKEIIGILTHLVDPTQNDSFQDKYFSGIDLDLSKALFIFSYNDVSLIDRILLDRIHRVKFEHLTLEDKLVITRKFVLPDFFKKMGLENTIEFSDDNITYIIENYTNEPGIRKFKELLFEIIGEINLSCLQNYDTIELPIIITNDDIKFKYLKEYHCKIDKNIPKNPTVGVINGLWANALGQGGVIPIETKYFPTTSLLDLKLTGLQGDVMKESMTVAKTLASSLVPSITMNKNYKSYKTSNMQGIHIHCPEGAVPKDGPSAGTAITVAIYSLLTGKKINNKFAITGEINLQGCVTAIGGLDLKILGGMKAGVTNFIFPHENEKDYNEFLEKYNDDSLNDIKFYSVKTIQEVFELIFVE